MELLTEKLDIDRFSKISDEQYVIQKAKKALESDPVAAKAWMLTAKTLYPNNFSVQFEAYKIEKAAIHVKEAAKCFSELVCKFQDHPEFWNEINKVTIALRNENDTADSEKTFLCEMFKHISSDVQHKLLLLTANNCDDTIEHCKLLILFLQRFPNAIASHGPGLVETLLTAEKHSHTSTHPVNSYRKLLVSDLLPILNSDNSFNMELSTKLLYKILQKAIEYYLSVLAEHIQKKDKSKGDDLWSSLFEILQFVGKYLGWEICLTNFDSNWSKSSYWQKVKTFYQVQRTNFDDPNILRQLAYCVILFLLYCLYQYNNSVSPELSPGLAGGPPNITISTPNSPNTINFGYVLVDAFVDPNLPVINNTVIGTDQSKIKKRKTSDSLSDCTSSGISTGTSTNGLPNITTEDGCSNMILPPFMMAINCWDLLHSSDIINREFVKFTDQVKLDIWLANFVIDYCIYKGQYNGILPRLQTLPETPDCALVKHITLANIYYVRMNYLDCFNEIVRVIQLLPQNGGSVTDKLTCGGSAQQRHLHFLPLTNVAILQFCAKILLRAIAENARKQGGPFSDHAIGHSLVLMQLNWQQECDGLPRLVDEIRKRGAFNYHLFQKYIVQVDILEELSYLWSIQGGQVTLDILPHLSQRRIGTRGADKGVKEELRQAIRRQIVRCNEPPHQLVLAFLTQEQRSLYPLLM